MALTEQQIQQKLLNFEPLKFSVTSQIQTQSQSIVTDCNAIKIKNLGTDPIIVLGETLQQDQYTAVNGNIGEIFTTNIFVAFANQTTDQRFLVQIKEYV